MRRALTVVLLCAVMCGVSVGGSLAAPVVDAAGGRHSLDRLMGRSMPLRDVSPSPSELIGRLMAVEKLEPRYLTKSEHDRLIAAAEQMRTTAAGASSEDKISAAAAAAAADKPGEPPAQSTRTATQ